MASITFPTSPTVNQAFTSGFRTWTWNGAAWLRNRTQNALARVSPNYIIVDVAGGTAASNGIALTTSYTAAKALTPNGAALSATNRATLFIPPGVYTLTADWVVDANFVDIAGVVATTGTPTVLLQTHTIDITAADVHVSGISTGAQAFNITGAQAQFFENCSGGTNSFGMGSDASGTFIYCTGGDNSFGASSSASGVFTNCTGGYGSFGGGDTASGIFTNCVGGNYSFGSSGVASGTFNNCVGGLNCFGGTAGVVTGFPVGTITVDYTTDTFSLASHGLVAGEHVRFQATTIPAPLIANRVYYISATGLTTGAFKISATPAGAVLNLTSNGTAVAFAPVFALNCTHQATNWSATGNATVRSCVNSLGYIIDHDLGA